MNDDSAHEDLKTRLREAEEIIRAQNRLVDAMYNYDLEISWPRDAGELQRAYENRYGVKLFVEGAQ